MRDVFLLYYVFPAIFLACVLFFFVSSRRSHHKIVICHLYSCQSRVYLHIINVYVSLKEKKNWKYDSDTCVQSYSASLWYVSHVWFEFHFISDVFFSTSSSSLSTLFSGATAKAAVGCVIPATTHVDFREIISKVLHIKWVNFMYTIRSVDRRSPVQSRVYMKTRYRHRRTGNNQTYISRILYSVNIFVLFSCEFCVRIYLCALCGRKNIRLGKKKCLSLLKQAIRIPGFARDSLCAALCSRSHSLLYGSVSFMGIIRIACSACMTVSSHLYCY